MTIYSSITAIKKDFHINDDNLDLIREQINEIRANSHPDKTHGKFESQEVETLYHKANSAIAYIDSIKNNQSLVVMEKMTDLVKIVTSLIPDNRQNSLEQNLESKISCSIRTYRSKFLFPKISLTTLTALVTFLFLFPNQVKDHPTLSHYINPASDLFAFFWFMTLSLSASMWMYAYMSEERSKRQLSSLKVDSVQNEIFNNFLCLESERENEFSKEGLTSFVYRTGNHIPLDGKYANNQRMMFTIFRKEIISMEIAQNVAEIIIARAEKNEIVRKVTRPTLYDTYEILNYAQD